MYALKKNGLYAAAYTFGTALTADIDLAELFVTRTAAELEARMYGEGFEVVEEE